MTNLQALPTRASWAYFPFRCLRVFELLFFSRIKIRCGNLLLATKLPVVVVVLPVIEQAVGSNSFEQHGRDIRYRFIASIFLFIYVTKSLVVNQGLDFNIPVNNIYVTQYSAVESQNYSWTFSKHNNFNKNTSSPNFILNNKQSVSYHKSF